jgi:hypothetical protein
VFRGKGEEHTDGKKIKKCNENLLIKKYFLKSTLKFSIKSVPPPYLSSKYKGHIKMLCSGMARYEVKYSGERTCYGKNEEISIESLCGCSRVINVKGRNCVYKHPLSQLSRAHSVADFNSERLD